MIIRTTTLLSAFLISTAALCQTTHEVLVTNFSFTPSTLEIAQGDTVRWMNAGGSHSVDGNAFDFPFNPMPFGNEISADAWTYQVAFDQQGVHNYKCGQHSSMTGMINVSDALSIDQSGGNDFGVDCFPNPAVDEISFKWSDPSERAKAIVRLYDATGKDSFNASFANGEKINISGLAAGFYTFRLQLGSKTKVGRLVVSR